MTAASLQSDNDPNFSSIKRPSMNTHRRSAGFTLIELMIAVVIVAIITVLAYPSYQDYLRKGRRASAQAFLMDLSNTEQRYLMDARAYATGSTALTTLNATVPSEVVSFYTVTIDPAAATTPPTFTITATPIAGSAQDGDGALTIDQAGNKTRAGQPGW